MKSMYTYLDLYDELQELTEGEKNWFFTTCQDCLKALGVEIPVYALRHDLLTGKSKDALGICWKMADSVTAAPKEAYITIDTYFIHECYEAKFHGRWNLSFETLESVIAHEVAHLAVWRHGKKHRELTARYCAVIDASRRAS